MDSALLVHRLHFAFTVTFHYLFPQLTMGLAPLIVVLKTLALRRNDETYNQAARFWARIFGINFVLGVVTGIPMEFQFGTNWSLFSRFAGGVIGQTLAMEGMFAFFLESAFLGLFLYGEKRLGPRGHWWSAVAVFVGSWLSGFFIIATDAWMQHPVGYSTAPNGSAQLTSFWALILNPWAWWQYAHNMSGAVITGAFVMASVGAFYLLWGKFEQCGRIFLRVGVTAALISSVLQLFPTGDGQGRMVAFNQPVTAGSVLILDMVSNSSNPAAAVSDTLGNTWQRVVVRARPSQSDITEMWYTPAASDAGPDVVTAVTDGGLPDIHISEYAGLASPALDCESSGETTTALTSSGSCMTSQPVDLLIGFIDTANSPDAGAGFTPLLTQSNNLEEEQVVFAAGSYAASFIQIDAGDAVTLLGAFKAAPVGDAGQDAGQDGGQVAGQDAGQDAGGGRDAGAPVAYVVGCGCGPGLSPWGALLALFGLVVALGARRGQARAHTSRSN